VEKVEPNNNRQAISVTLPPNVIAWLDKKVESRIYASRSHGVELLIIEAAMRESGSSAWTPASFSVEHEFKINGQDKAALEDLGRRFKKALGEAWGIGARTHVLLAPVAGKSRFYFTLKKLSSNSTAKETVEEFVGISEDLNPVRLLLKLTRDPTGGPGRLEGVETSLSREEFENYGLKLQQVFAMVDRFTRGLDLY
jgi:hypothetical protein